MKPSPSLAASVYTLGRWFRDKNIKEAPVVRLEFPTAVGYYAAVTELKRELDPPVCWGGIGDTKTSVTLCGIKVVFTNMEERAVRAYQHTITTFREGIGDER